jgi:hypothetical protein
VRFGATVALYGGSGGDRLLLAGSGDVLLDGGSDSDQYVFAGSPSANVTIGETTTGAGDTSSDSLDFSSFTATGGIVFRP